MTSPRSEIANILHHKFSCIFTKYFLNLYSEKYCSEKEFIKFRRLQQADKSKHGIEEGEKAPTKKSWIGTQPILRNRSP